MCSTVWFKRKHVTALYTLIPVSYTHLDVYKRQLYTLPKAASVYPADLNALWQTSRTEVTQNLLAVQIQRVL